MSEPIKSKCIICKHTIWYDQDDHEWKHSHYLHNDNCGCRDPKRSIIEKEKKDGN